MKGKWMWIFNVFVCVCARACTHVHALAWVCIYIYVYICIFCSPNKNCIWKSWQNHYVCWLCYYTWRSNLKTGEAHGCMVRLCICCREVCGLAWREQQFWVVLFPEGNRGGEREVKTAQEVWHNTEKGQRGGLFSETRILRCGPQQNCLGSVWQVELYTSLKYYKFWKSWEVERFALSGQ